VNTYLFDLDGTLLDSIGLILESFHHTSRVHRGRELPDSFWLQGIGIPLRDQLSRIAESVEERDAMLDTYRTFNLEQHDSMVKPFPGVVDVVKELHGRGANLALVTSKLRLGADRGIRLLGLDEELGVRICADDVTNGKPHPEPVLKALEALRATPEGAVFIGDSDHDIESGTRAGVSTAAVAWGALDRKTLEAAAPDHWLAHPSQILDL
jgi:pyrophosphatase PpaX